MVATFVETMRDETLRLEVGCPALSGLAVENLELSSRSLSQAVRQSIIERRVVQTVVRRMPGANRLEMHQVELPDAA
ncbi:MAG: hypothetical protein LC792_07450 [Actinobacteria bacterium]|nr:hypothetical protein [Actinomycetota bacterium]